MDTSAVIQLSCQAAESVLRFRAVGFTRRPVIDLQSFRAAISTQIEKAAKDHRHCFEIPLAEVVSYAGIGAARAAQQWNDISHKENHVVTEWFRNCVCNLVSGVVNDIGQMAFEDQGMNACMYLEPDEYDPFDVSSYSTASSVSKSSPYIPSGRDDYYGFQQVEDQQNDGSLPAPRAQWTAFHAVSAASRPLPLRHEIAQGYAALEQLAASQNDNAARADFIQSTKRLRNVSEPITADAQDTLLKRPAKRARQNSGPARPSPLSAGLPVNKLRWTDDEINILVTAREFGRDWHEVGNMLPRHTSVACRTKYRAVKNKDGKSETEVPSNAPAVGEQGQNKEAQIPQKDLETGPGIENANEMASANLPNRNGLQATSLDESDNLDKQDDGKQDDGKQSVVDASSNSDEAEVENTGVPTEESTMKGKE